MNKDQVIEKVCHLASVCGEQLDNQYAHDCFCSDCRGFGFQFESEVLDYMERAILDYPSSIALKTKMEKLLTENKLLTETLEEIRSSHSENMDGYDAFSMIVKAKLVLRQIRELADD